MGRGKDFLDDFASDSNSSASESDLEFPSALRQEQENGNEHRRKRRRTGRDAKEAAALGVFGSESEDERLGGGKWKSKNLRNKNVSFIGQGQRVQDDDDEDEEIDDATGFPRRGFPGASINSEGASGTSTPRSFDAHTGLGFAPAEYTGAHSTENTASNNPLGKEFMSSFAASRVGMPAFQPAGAQTPPPVVRPSFTATRATNGKGKTHSGPVSANPESFAARMMAKMGYVEGKGLGKTGEGRLTPVETKLRPQGAGLGAVREQTKQEKREARRTAELRGEIISDSEDKKRKKKAARKNRAFSDGTFGVSPGLKKEKTRFKTAEEMSATARGLEVPITLKNLIDFTGKEAKLLPSPAGIMGQRTTPDGNAEGMKIARMARRDLESFTKDWKLLQDRKAYFENEEARLVKEVDEHVQEYNSLNDMVDIVKATQELSLKAAEKGSDNQEAVEAVVAQLEELQFKYKNEIESDDLSEVAVGALHPLFKAAVANWSPLVDPFSTYLDHFRRLHAVLGIHSKEDLEVEYSRNGFLERAAGNLTTPYESMILNHWLPKVRAAINNEWNVHNPMPVLTLLDAWHPVLPPFVQANILSQLILPKIRSAVSDWNPRLQSKFSNRKRRTPAPHLWVFQWLPYLGTHMDELLRDIRTKFGIILNTWDILQPLEGLDAWREVFGADKLESLLIRHLLPRLASHLSAHFVVNPADQVLDPLEAVFKWTAFFRPSTFAKLLEVEFFPKWLNILHLWLTADGVILTEVQQWYLFWQDVFPPDLRATPLMKEGFKKGLDMMNDAIDLGPGAAAALPAPAAGPAPPIRNRAAETKAPGKREAPAQETTFRNVVEDWCAEHNLLLVPLRKADEASGLPLFRITTSASGTGGLLVYLKGDVIWVQARRKRDVFAPVGLDEILQKLEWK